METHETVRRMTSDQRSEIIAIMIGVIPDMSFDEAQYGIIDDREPFVADIRTVFEMRRIIANIRADLERGRNPTTKSSSTCVKESKPPSS